MSTEGTDYPTTQATSAPPTMSNGKAYDTLYSYGVNGENATPMVRQFLAVKNQYPGVVLFYRMGDFYETFFEDALITAKVLEITLTGRDAGACGKIPMAGIPVKAVEGYLSRLLTRNFKVAICEQVEDPAVAKGLVERRVVRVLSPGTITEQTLLKPEENNFLAAVAKAKTSEAWGLAYCDVTTGTFCATELSFGQLLSELQRITPTEVLVPGRIQKALPGQGVDVPVPDVPIEITGAYACTPLPTLAYEEGLTEKKLEKLMGVANLEGYGLHESALAKLACGAVAHYLHETFLDSPPTFDRIQRYHLQNTMALSSGARQSLELLSTVKTGRSEGSLLNVLNHTTTSMGARLLRQWVSQPLTHLPEITSRLDGVDELVKHPSVRESLRKTLPDIYDLERLASRVANLSASPRDLIALKQSIARLPEIATLVQPLNSFYMLRLHQFPPELFKAVALIDQAIADSPAQGILDGGIMKAGYHPQLDQIRETLATHDAWIAQYEATQRERTGIKTLKVSYNNAFGYTIELSKANAHLAPEDYRRKQTLTNAERFTTEALKAQETKFLEAQGKQNTLEYSLYLELREKLLAFAPVLKDCAGRIATLDVLQSLATVAVENNYVRPVVDDSLELNIQEGRHPVVEAMIPSGRFVPNTCVLSSNENDPQVPQLLMITGPNMAGKSTYMRQVALIILMAQMGSFVPATYARIGLVDALYTRVGAVDDLSSGQSTFMVEMNETAQILNSATQRSFVLLDEVGRGTSTYDGVAIAWSVCEHLVNTTRCRTLFATHYHELNALEGVHPKVQNVRACVSERNGVGACEIEFLHKVEPGAAQKSYGIQVARMAGVPQSVITRASGLLSTMQKREAASVVSGKPRLKESLKDGLKGEPDLTADSPAPQLSLF